VEQSQIPLETLGMRAEMEGFTGVAVGRRSQMLMGMLPRAVRVELELGTEATTLYMGIPATPTTAQRAPLPQRRDLLRAVEGHTGPGLT